MDPNRKCTKVNWRSTRRRPQICPLWLAKGAVSCQTKWAPFVSKQHKSYGRKVQEEEERERVVWGGGKLNPVKLFFHSLWVWHRALTTHARCEISCSKCKPDGTRLQRRECLEFNPLSHVRVTARPLQRCHHAALKHRGHPALNICLRPWGGGGWPDGFWEEGGQAPLFLHTPSLERGRVFFISSLRTARHGHTDISFCKSGGQKDKAELMWCHCSWTMMQCQQLDTVWLILKAALWTEVTCALFPSMRCSGVFGIYSHHFFRNRGFVVRINLSE